MRTLLVLRHAKAHPDAPSGDWSRDLTERGRRDAETMGELIKERIGRPDAFVSSDAHRAKQTAEIAAEAIGFDGEIVLEHAIYEAWFPDLIDVVRSLPQEAGIVVIVGHNPGLEALVVALAGSDPTEVRLPSAGLAHLEVNIARWAEVGPGSGHLVALYTPKEAGG